MDRETEEMLRTAKYYGKRIGLGILALVVFVKAKNLAYDSFAVVPAGHRGVLFSARTGIKPVVLDEGWNWKNPIFDTIIPIDIRVQKAHWKESAASKDLQEVTTDFAVNFSLSPDVVFTTYKTYGTNYQDTLVEPAVLEAVKAATAKYTAEELVTRREEVKNDATELVRGMLAKAGIKLEDTFITDFQFSPDYAKAVESKQIAEQNALQAQRVLEQVKIEANQKVARAEAEAKSLRLQRDAITPMMLELRKIELQKAAVDKWDGQFPQMMTGNAVPFINMTLDKKAQ